MVNPATNPSIKDPAPTSPASTDGSVICPVQQRCGGCPLLHLTRTAELDTKLATVRAAFAEVGLTPPPLSVRTAGQRTGYRNRLRMKVEAGRADFFNQAKRDGCPVLRTELWTAIDQLRIATAANPTLLGSTTHVEVRLSDADGTDNEPRIGLALGAVADAAQPPDRFGLGQSLGEGWVVGHPEQSPVPTLPYRTAASLAPFAVPVTSFVQVNSAVNRLLVGEVMALATRIGASTFLDLFSGAGNFALPLLSLGLSGLACDDEGAAMTSLASEAARVAAGGAGSAQLATRPGDVRQLLMTVEGETSNATGTTGPDLSPADLVIVDPPRAGLRQGYSGLAKLVLNRLVLVSCYPKSLAVDLVALGRLGLAVETVMCFDMFPGTSHIETMTVLKKA